MKVSVIIPTLNEATTLSRTIEGLLPLGPDEIIIGDGGSTDGTQDIAGRYSVRLVPCPRGRAAQMNHAAQTANGDLLLFLHADTSLVPAGYTKMTETMGDDKWVGGAYSLHIESTRKTLRLVSRLANWRSRFLNLAYGDQAFFVRKETFHKLGGFADLPICEDLEFYRRLYAEGPVLLLKHKANTSARRWEQDGVVFGTLRNSLIATAFLMGCSPRILSRWYPPRR